MCYNCLTNNPDSRTTCKKCGWKLPKAYNIKNMDKSELSLMHKVAGEQGDTAHQRQIINQLKKRYLK